MARRNGRREAIGKWAPDGRLDAGKESLSERPEVNLAGGNQFATRTRVNDFLRLMRTLPDPDPVLKKMGRGITALQELLIDSHLESVWSIRCSAASGAEWFMAAGDEGKKEQEAADAFAAELSALDIPRIIEEMMDAVAYGYSPLEIIWEGREGKWGIGNIVGKPPQWFAFNPDNKLVFRTGITGTEELPENRFLLVSHRPSYANPYGDKIFSKCFWPVTFKRNGWRWWTVFVEKYGGAFSYGTYPANASEQFKKDLLSALEGIIADAVAIIPDGAEITITQAADKNGSSGVHTEFIKMANAEISKAVLGETLTTEIGDKGSYAAAETHNEVRRELAAADRRRISAAFNRLAAVYTFYNFGTEVVPPVFTFVEDEDLQAGRAERDVKLHQLGWRPKKAYIAREYGIPEEDFELPESSGGEAPHSGFSRRGKHPADCPCGCHAEPEGLMGKLAALFASKGEKAAGKDTRLMEEFAAQMFKAGQEEIDATVEAYVDALGGVNNFDDAAEALMAAYQNRNSAGLASLANEVRYAASGIGGRHG
ncbi:MAG: DUF935 domain-containing protein [Spirochaetaceae bacterium]|jgi:phage gp29-like protein|nr:DUF935 domain-containing protein [Spirochaetaceae bacterium]